MPGPAPRSGYPTQLSHLEEYAYRLWLQQISEQIGRTIHPDDPTYDMRGYWKALQVGGQGMGIDPSSGEMHFPDTFKTPEHPTMSNQSIYAPPGAPSWNSQDQLVDQQGIPTLGYLQELMRRGQ